MGPFHAAVADDNLLYVPTQQMRLNPVDTMHTITNFLGLEKFHGWNVRDKHHVKLGRLPHERDVCEAKTRSFLDSLFPVQARAPLEAMIGGQQPQRPPQEQHLPSSPGVVDVKEASQPYFPVPYFLDRDVDHPCERSFRWARLRRKALEVNKLAPAFWERRERLRRAKKIVDQGGGPVWRIVPGSGEDEVQRAPKSYFVKYRMRGRGRWGGETMGTGGPAVPVGGKITKKRPAPQEEDFVGDDDDFASSALAFVVAEEKRGPLRPPPPAPAPATRTKLLLIDPDPDRRSLPERSFAYLFDRLRSRLSVMDLQRGAYEISQGLLDPFLGSRDTKPQMPFTLLTLDHVVPGGGGKSFEANHIATLLKPQADREELGIEDHMRKRFQAVDEEVDGGEDVSASPSREQPPSISNRREHLSRLHHFELQKKLENKWREKKSATRHAPLAPGGTVDGSESQI